MSDRGARRSGCNRASGSDPPQWMVLMNRSIGLSVSRPRSRRRGRECLLTVGVRGGGECVYGQVLKKPTANQRPSREDLEPAMGVLVFVLIPVIALCGEHPAPGTKIVHFSEVDDGIYRRWNL